MPKPSLQDKLKGVRLPRAGSAGPVWAGPEGDGPQGGVTFSLLSRYLCCKERFRLLVVEGLKPTDRFERRLEFGNLWHVMEAALASGDGLNPDAVLSAAEEFLGKCAAALAARYPHDRPAVTELYAIVAAMFPEYVGHWRNHPDVRGYEPVPGYSERTFDVPYRLPSGRTVRLRGRWDSVGLVRPNGGKVARVWIQENKSKSEIDREAVERQLTCDLQTMLYVVALREEMRGPFWRGAGAPRPWRGAPLAGVRYNVVKRPRQYQGKKESADEFIARLRGIVTGSPDEFFARWNVPIDDRDVQIFRETCLDPVLENLCNWWMVQTGALAGTQDRQDYLVNFGHHYRFPFGVYNVTLEGGYSDLDERLRTGSEHGLRRVTDLFPELKD